jgi:hypothetical protein
MKKLFLLLLLIFGLGVSAQGTVPSYPTIKLTKTTLGTKLDSTLVIGTNGTVKHFPISGIKGTTNLNQLATPTNVIIYSDTGTDAAIPLVTDTNAGAQPPSSKIKLDGIATGATANDTDANLKNRANHTGAQAITTVTGLQPALDGKVDKVAGKGLSTEDYTTVEKEKLSGIANGATANQTDTYLLNRVNHSGTQPISTVTGLQPSLDTKVDKVGGKSLLSDTEITRLSGLSNYTHPANHPPSIITQDPSNRFVSDAEKAAWNAKQSGLGYPAENASNKNTANGYAGLGADGKLISSQLPSITISDTFVTGSQAAMLAVIAETGDVAVRTDLNKSFILKGTNPAVLADWQELLTPTSAVTTVFGRNGAITAQTGDYTADQITETATRKFQSANQQTFNDATSSIQSQLNAKVSNATHTGDATGSTALTVRGINGTLLSGLSTGILKNTTTTGVPVIAVARTDYAEPTTALATGILKNTTTTGAHTIAGAIDFPVLNQNTTGTASTITGNIAESQVTGLVSDLSNKQNNIGYTTENSANKSDSYMVSSSTTYTSTKALVEGLGTKQNTLTNPVTGTLTVGTLPKASGTSTLTNSLVSESGSLVTTNGYVKVPNSTGGIINGNSGERLMSLSGWSASPNMNRDIVIGNVQLEARIQVVLTGSFGVGNAQGCVIKEFEIGANQNNVMFENRGAVTYAAGSILTQYAIGDFYWDATNSVYAIRISKLITATTSNLRVKILMQNINSVDAILPNITISSEYTATALTRNFVNLPNNTGVGTASLQTGASYIPIVPVSNLHIAENTTATNTTAGHTIEQAGTGDAVTQYLLTGVQRWVIGIDNSDGDKFKIAAGELGTADKVIIDPTSSDVGITGRVSSGTTVLNNLPPTANNHLVRWDYLKSVLPTTYTQTVYVNNINPNSATIFDLNNPPTVNNNALKTDVNNLYIGSDASAWVYNGSIYVTKTDTAATSNFFITGTNIDLGNSKTANASRMGTITAPAFIKTGGTGSEFLKANGTVDATAYSPTSHTHSSTTVTPSTVDGNTDRGVLFSSFSNSLGSVNFPTSAGITIETRRSAPSSSSVGTFQTYSSNTSSDENFYFRKVNNYSSVEVWSAWRKVLHEGNFSTYALPIGGGTLTGDITGTKFIKSGGTAAQFLKANGDSDGTVYATLDSPNFTGIPNVPTAALGTNSPQAASCAFVRANAVNTLTAQIIGGQKTFTSAQTLFDGGISAVGGASVSGVSATNSTSGIGIFSFNTSTGTGMQIWNDANGHGLIINGRVSASGFNFIGQDNGTNTFTVNKTGYLTANLIKTSGFTVSTLPIGQPIGTMAYVTDALAPTYMATVAGGGSVVTPVFYNGTNWVSH